MSPLSHLADILERVDKSTLIATLSSIFTLTPSSSTLFPLLTLPSLLHKSDSYRDQDSSKPFKKAASAALGSTIGSLLTAWKVLPNFGEAAGAQTLFSTIIALYIYLILKIQETVVEKWMFEDKENWAISSIFGLIWAVMWFLWTKISPFGRYVGARIQRLRKVDRQGIPTPEDLDISHKLLKWIGPVGVDYLVGLSGHVISRTYQPHGRDLLKDVLRLTPFARSPISSSPASSTYGAITPDSSPTRPTTRVSSATTDVFSPEETPVARAEAAEREEVESSIQVDERTPLTPTSTRRRSFQTPRPPSTLPPPPTMDDPPRRPSWKGPRKMLYSLTALAGILGQMSASVTPADGPVSEVTPLVVGCAIPPQLHPTLDDVTLALRHFGNRAQLLILPETALSLRYEGERIFAIDHIQHAVAEQYGAHVAISMETPVEGKGKASNEVVLVGPHGVLGSYEKKSLFPLVESHRFQTGQDNPPVWTLHMTHPHGITKPEWSHVYPFVRPIPFTPLICLDSLHPNLISTKPAPSFLIVPATAQPELAHEVIKHTAVLAATHRIPAIVCSRGASAAIDENGNVFHQQEGGQGFVATLAIPWYGDGGIRPQSWSEKLGPMSVLGILACGTLLVKMTEVYSYKGPRGLVQGAKDGVSKLQEGGDHIRGLLMWREGEAGWGQRFVEWFSAGPRGDEEIGLKRPIEPTTTSPGRLINMDSPGGLL